jgi:3-hydroxyacyl-CoA dehydrogenase/enoyl-CoA hydratase/3-hydroxybutyryl-CoA epimerase
MQPEDAERLFAETQQGKHQLRRLETLGLPVVAAMSGTMLGGGLEILLASHHRVCLDDPKIQLGFPQANLGIMPGDGGVARLTRMLGLQGSQPYLQDGKLLNPREAQKRGVINELADSAEGVLERARAWILANPEAKQPWDRPGFSIPGGTVGTAAINRWLAVAPAQVRAKWRGCYPAPDAILAASVEGSQVDMDTACRIESRYFTNLATGQVAKNIIGTFWFQQNEIKAGKSRPSGIPPWKATKVGILGAGMMGAGIAYVSAAKGLPVVLKDVSRDAALKGKGYAEKVMGRRVEKGELSADAMQATLDRIQTTDAVQDLRGCDMVIEAVFEKPELKHHVTRETEPVLSADAVWASNTSTLPITGLATASQRPANFVGLHFFSPVDKMQLVEVIVGKKSAPETLARAFDFVRQLGKVPIVVNDNRGFFTSRVFSTYTREGVAMLGEGQLPSAIEMAAFSAGFPVGPLAVLDEVSLALSYNNRLETLKAFADEGRPLPPHPADAVMERMVNGFGRKGRTAGGGFYDYPAGEKKTIWPGLYEHFVRLDHQIPRQDVGDRLLFCMAVESARTLEEGILNSSRDANIGSVIGIGFPRWTGGVLQFLNQYGLKNAVARCRELAGRYGERFAPPGILLEKAQRDETF